MNLRSLIPYLVPLLVLLLIYRRIGRVRKVRVNRLWLMPAVIALASASAIYATGTPPFLWGVAYVFAAAAGMAVGYFRASHMHLSVHPDTGDVQATQTPVATFILMGLFAVKFALNTIFPELNGGRPAGAMSALTPDSIETIQAAHQISSTAAAANYATDALLIFTTVMFVTSAAETWLRANRLIAAHKGESGEISE